MKRTTLAHLRQYKGHQKFTCVTAYDATFAHWASESEVEMILVGDSLGMVLQGRDSTLPVTLQDMCYHTQAVARGNQNCLIMSDVPFMQAASVERALQAAEALMQAGAEIIKIEGDERLAPVVSALNAAGVPVCVHLGLTPQFVHRFGGYKVQGRDEASRDATLRAVQAVQEAGADLLLLECVPSDLAAQISSSTSLPVIGIGAGAETDAQVLVMHDMLGFNPHRLARFVRVFAEPGDTPADSFTRFNQAVLSGEFPAAEHRFDT
ncbi:MAG: 3-methyl-2-oxobutanoate hydroxymethyltransferase [Litorivicinus sp.]